ncbi:hypothetical protein [Brevundimonas sp. SORGH_AS_0993]|uniref:hypothetical protein n=1 Tax=Brevundimonas sp. SORGH_AS_0993 TaxID=3041794 RepID=UPI003593A9DD
MAAQNGGSGGYRGRTVPDGNYGRRSAYAHEAALAALYPGNNNFRPKIRQQLQVLRDRGWLAFDGRGVYRRV